MVRTMNSQSTNIYKNAAGTKLRRISFPFHRDVVLSDPNCTGNDSRRATLAGDEANGKFIRCVCLPSRGFASRRTSRIRLCL